MEGNRLDREIAKIEEKDKLLKRIQESIDDNGDCTDWEDDFLDRIKRQLEQGKIDELSNAQEHTLGGIEFMRAEGRDAWWEEYGRRKRGWK